MTTRMVLGGVAVAALVAAAAYFLAADRRQTPVDGGPIAEVTVPDLTAVQRTGEALFEENCASCHGPNAAGSRGAGPPLVHGYYEPGHHADAAFLLAVQNGVRQHHWTFGNMPPVPDVTQDEVEQIVAYVRALQRANGIN